MKAKYRKDVISGEVPYTCLMEEDGGFIQFNEWYNGEGLDIDLVVKYDITERLQLHSDQLTAIAVAAVTTGQIDLEEVTKQVKEMESNVRKWEESLDKFKQEF